MSETKWTPQTPYQVITLNDHFAVADAIGNHIAMVKRTLPGAERIARQLAAEPDLYEALDRAVRNFGGRELEGSWEDDARAALAKARGEA